MLSVSAFVMSVVWSHISPAGLLAAESADPNWISYLLNGGPFALVVLLVVMDKITNTSERDRLRAENATLREEIRVLNASIRTDIVPPLVQINSLMKDVVEELSYRGKYYLEPKDSAAAEGRR